MSRRDKDLTLVSRWCRLSQVVQQHGVMWFGVAMVSLVKLELARGSCFDKLELADLLTWHLGR